MLNDIPPAAAQPMPFPSFPWVTQYTPVIPKLYWDVYSQEERIKKLCMEYARIVQYISDMASHINDSDVDNTTKFAAINAHLNALDKLTTDLKKTLDAYTKNLPVYNPTRGKFESSQKTNRDMYRELAVFGARVDQCATLTTEQLAEHDTLEVPVIGNYTIFNDTKPRVTPVTDN